MAETALQTHYLQQELEQKMQSDSTLWGFVMRGSLDGVWYWNLEAPEDEWMSPEFWETFGVDPTTMRHDPAEWQDRIFPEDLEIATANFQRHCADPDHPYDQICRYWHEDGSTVWVRCRGIAIRDETGRPTRMLGAHNDVTALKRAEHQAVERQRALERANAALEAANAELRALAYGISHDLKAPVNTACMLIAEIAAPENGPLDDTQSEMVDYARRTMSRMSDIIESVLVYARLVGAEADRSLTDPKHVLRKVLDAHRDTIEQSGAVVDIGNLPDVPVGEKQLYALFQNLLDNAFKFQRQGVPPRIGISGHADEQAVTLSVSDNGIGIEPAHLEKIFGLFARLHNRDEYYGMGLGLAICERLCRNMGATLSATSAPGQGSTFTVTIPNPGGTQ